MAGIVRFKVNKYVHGTRSKNVFDFKPKAQILFEGERIGHIIDREVYFYIRVKHVQGEPECMECLNYTPELWNTFSTHREAKDVVIKQAESIWKTLDIYHRLKTFNQPMDYGKRSKANKQLGMEESIGYDYPWMDKYPDTAMVIYQVVISLGICGPRKR